MNRLIPLIILAFSVVAFSQTTERAVPTYSINDKLIGLSNLYTGLKDCSIQSVSGKVKDVDRIGNNAVEVTIKVDKKTRIRALIPLDRVAPGDKKAAFRHLITKNNVIRVSGYACNTDEPFSAFSVDRVY